MTVLSVSSYSQDYIDACRASVRRQVAAYAAVARLAGDGDDELATALRGFEPQFFTTMVLALDAHVTHRARTLEGKDGNPLNEVRVLCSSILLNDGKLAADKTIRLKSATSVLGCELGDEISLTASDFSRLSEAFFGELERRYRS